MNVFSRIPGLAALAAAATLLFGASQANANTINVVNGSFEQTSSNSSSQLGLNGYTVNGWTNDNNGYNFLFQPGTADTTGSKSEYTDPSGQKRVALIGKNNTLSAAALPVSPDGGNFVALDGNFRVGALYQQLTGLTVGALTTVMFDWAQAEQFGFPVNDNGSIAVTLGSQTLSTPTLNATAVGGFSGWKQAKLTFTATSTSERLSFLATGAPSGAPPFSLLDGVSVSDNVAATPEPGSLALLGTGVLSMAGLLRRRYLKS